MTDGPTRSHAAFELFATKRTRHSCRSANVLSNCLRMMLLPIRPSWPNVFEAGEILGLAYSLDPR